MATGNTSSIQQKYMGGMDQSATRDHAVWFDQHRNSSFTDRNGEKPFLNGRAWWSVIEKRSGMPSGSVHPLEWEAPFDVPQSYLIASIGRISKLTTRGAALMPVSTKTDRFFVDYARMLTDDKQAQLEHWRLCVANATRYQLPIPKQPGADLDYRLVELAGPEPRSPKIAQALQSGDPWILGQKMPVFDKATGLWVVEENEELAKLLRRTVRNGLMPQDVEHPAPPQEVQDLAGELRAMRARIAELEGNRAAPKVHKPLPKAAKAGRTPEQVEADRARMATVRAARG